MDSVLPIVWCAIALAVTAAAWWRRRGLMRADGVARRAGLSYSDVDPFDSTRVAFPLFRKGDDRGAENVMWRPGEGIPRARAFDYWYDVERRDEYGNVRRTRYWHSCAVALVGGSWPLITIEPETVVDRIGHHVGLPDIELESEEFNRTFAVHCEDRRFATTLLDPRMMAVLLRTGGAVTLQLRGRWLLVHVDRAASKVLPGLLKVAEDFVAAIPKVVWDLYPSPFAGPEGELLPEALRAVPVPTEEGDDDPWDVLARSPWDALGEPGRPEYDLDGKVVPPVVEDPWRDLPGKSPDGAS